MPKLSIQQQKKQIRNFNVKVVFFEALRRRKEALKKMDDLIIIREATHRRKKLRETQGPYATVKKMVDCPACLEKFSVRRLREHWPKCPKRSR